MSYAYLYTGTGGLESKKVGIIIILITVVLLFVVQLYTQTIIIYGEELHKNCPLPTGVCPYKRGALPIESVLGYVVTAVLGSFGAYLLITSRRIERVATFQKSKFKNVIKSLQEEEKRVYQVILDSEGSAFQSDIVAKTGYSKVKVSRILDLLETKGVVERRRGMTNLIVLKY